MPFMVPNDEEDEAVQSRRLQASRARMENSLGELTRKFINLIMESKDNFSVDLNEAAE